MRRARNAVGTLRDWPWAYYAGFALGRSAPIAVLPVVAHFDGPAGLGRFEVALAVIGATAIVFDAGMGNAVIRFWRDSRVTPETIVGSAVAIQLASSTAAVFVFLPLMLAAGPEGESRVALVLAMALFAIVEGLGVVASGILRARRADRTFFLLSVARVVTTLTLGVSGAALGGATGALFGVALGGVGFAGFTVRAWAQERGIGSAATRRALARYGFPLIATTIAGWTLTLSDRLFLRFTVSPDEIGQYTANYRFASIVLMFVATPLVLVWVAEAQRTESHLRPAKVRRWAVGYSAVALSAGLALVLLGSVLVPVVFGDRFHPDTFVIALVVVSGWLYGVYFLLATPVLVGDAPHALAVGALVTVGANALLNATLIPAFETDGAAVATTLSYVVFCATAAVAARREAASATKA